MENLTIQSVANAVILPYRRCRHSTGLGGVIDETGVYVERSYLHGGLFEHGGSYDFDKSTIVKSDDRVVYFGYYLPHWGHFLIDCLGRMWPFASPGNEQYENYKIAYISNSHEGMYDNCYEFFAALGINRKRIIQVDKPTQFREVLIPDVDYTAEPNRVFAPQYLRLYDTVVEDILSKHNLGEVKKKFGNIEKVYFTRSKFRGAKSREVGLQIIDEVMKNGGYNIIAPEKLTLSEQVLIWNSAKRIACINGTIPLNVIFHIKNRNPLTLTVLNKMPHIHRNLMEYLSLRGDVICEFVDVQDARIKDLSIGDGRGLGPFRVGISTELTNWMVQNHIPTDSVLYKENLPLKKLQYNLMFLINSPRPWLAQHLPESLRSLARRILRK